MSNQQTAENLSYQMQPVKPVKRAYASMRQKDMEQYERELETSRQQMENPQAPTSEATASESAEQPENPNPANESPKSVDWQKRYSDAQSHFTKEINVLKSTVSDLTQKLTESENKLKESANKIVYPTTEEELTAWAEQFPPLYNIMRTIVLKEKTAEVDALKKSIKDLEDFKQSIANERGRVELLKLHPDANEIEKDPRFAQWYQEQEPEIQSLVDSGLPNKIGKAITIFKKDLGIVTKSAQDKQREASKAVNIGPTQPNLPKEEKVWRESEVQRLTPKQYERLEPEIEKARAEGRYVRDLTGAN